MSGPVIWNGPGGSVFTPVMRVSGPDENDKPVPPVLSSDCAADEGGPSPTSVFPKNGGVLGAPATSGGGRKPYTCFCSRSALMKNLPPLGGATILNCCAFAKFGPGVPSALTIPCDSKLRTRSCFRTG